jgi:hypothetical protein
MAKQVQLRRGTTAEHEAFTGAEGEVTYNTEAKVLVVHDGTAQGGIPIANQSTVSAIAIALGL